MRVERGKARAPGDAAGLAEMRAAHVRACALTHVSPPGHARIQGWIPGRVQGRIQGPGTPDQFPHSVPEGFSLLKVGITPPFRKDHPTRPHPWTPPLRARDPCVPGILPIIPSSHYALLLFGPQRKAGDVDSRSGRDRQKRDSPPPSP